MKHTLIFRNILPLILFLALAPAASASSTWYVDGVNGNDSNDCLSSQTACKTIGHAISLCSSGDTIKVAPAIYTENLTIDRSLTILGSDAATTIVDGNQAGTAFTISSTTGNVRLSKLTIRNGAASVGGGINSGGATLKIEKSIISGNSSTGDSGGGIFNSGALTINRSIISGNSGHGIYTSGSLAISNSTIRDNVSAGWGGGIYVYSGSVAINKSTVSGNRAGNNGGAIAIWRPETTLAINNSTISNNQAGNCAGGIFNWNYGGVITVSNSTISGNQGSYGGGLYQASPNPITLQNTIIANPGVNCYNDYGATEKSNGYNLSSDGTCNLNGPGDMNNTEPKLGKFGKYGGPTKTILLLPGSPAIDAGNPNGCTDDKGNLLKTDQRGWARPGKYDQDKRCDMGAFERQHD